MFNLLIFRISKEIWKVVFLMNFSRKIYFKVFFSSKFSFLNCSSWSFNLFNLFKCSVQLKVFVFLQPNLYKLIHVDPEIYWKTEFAKPKSAFIEFIKLG